MQIDDFGTEELNSQKKANMLTDDDGEINSQSCPVSDNDVNEGIHHYFLSSKFWQNIHPCIFVKLFEYSK